MNGPKSQFIYKQLLERHGQIRIPMIQRDYAQGRPSEAEVRDTFLDALKSALMLPADDLSLPLNLDFIYGSVEGERETRFSPLDGQQRLTTLFLLHWYLAWNDGCLHRFHQLFRVNGKSRFSYDVRSSSNEFFNELIAYQPDRGPKDVEVLKDLITNQPWYFRSWRLDPTIQAALTMLDALHERFLGTTGLFERLTSEAQPVITFQLLDLDNFGLSDDLYIKMNARGKPLTPFETFKARYEQELARQFEGDTRSIGDQEFSIAEFIARRMDTKWADLFWAHRDKKTHLYDEAVMNLFRLVALVSRDPEAITYQEDVSLLRSAWDPPSYATFYRRGWLDRPFTETLISLLESWCATDGSSKQLLPNSRYFDEKKLFERVIQNPSTLSLPEIIQFSGYTLFIKRHELSLNSNAFQEWMRVVRNLAVNSYIERIDELRNTTKGLRELLPYSMDILKYVSQMRPEDRVSGFADQQVKEETLKAGLILNHADWRALIDRAEGHGYFCGQIEFLCEFSGATEEWKNSGTFCWEEHKHVLFQNRFEEYLKKAEGMFARHGLVHLSEYRWERALMVLGDYLLPSRTNNRSFLVNPSTDSASWKRLLRGASPLVAEKRKLLGQLWDRLKTDRTFTEQLDEIIANASSLKPWIEAIVRTPEALAYCSDRSIRWNSETEIYLLSKIQMNGSHAELYTFCLYHNVLQKLDKDGRLKPLKLSPYQFVIGMDDAPHVLLTFPYKKHRLHFRIDCARGGFRTRISRPSLDIFPEILTCLRGSEGFKETESFVSIKSASENVQVSLIELSAGLAAL